MDLTAGEAVQRRLWEFLELAAKENATSDEGLRLLDELKQSVGRLEQAYYAQTPRTEPEPRAEGPPGDTPIEELPLRTGHDNKFVAWFARMNSDIWQRRPGDKLTLRQKSDIAALIFLMILAAAILAVGGGLLVNWLLDTFNTWRSNVNLGLH